MDNINTPEELLDFMSNNFNYGYLSKTGHLYRFNDDNFDFDWFNEYKLQTADELLETKVGNCFDQVEFERDWFLKHNYEIKTIFEMVNLSYENDYQTHSFLAYKDKDNNWCWFENADYDNRGIHKFDSFDKLIDYEYKLYLEGLKEKHITDEEINKIIITEFNKPKENSSAREYLDHVINSHLWKKRC